MFHSFAGSLDTCDLFEFLCQTGSGEYSLVEPPIDLLTPPSSPPPTLLFDGAPPVPLIVDSAPPTTAPKLAPLKSTPQAPRVTTRSSCNSPVSVETEKIETKGGGVTLPETPPPTPKVAPNTPPIVCVSRARGVPLEEYAARKGSRMTFKVVKACNMRKRITLK